MKIEEIAPGDMYEDAFLHPCICIGVEEGCAWGVSLIDGSYPRTADIRMGARKISLEEAWRMKMDWP